MERNPARHIPVWEEWWRTELDRKTPDNLYAMRIAMEIRATRQDLAGKNIDPNEFIFNAPNPPKVVQTPEQIKASKRWYAKMAIIAWAGRLGCKIDGLEVSHE